MTQVELANELTAANARLAAANTNLANANNQLLKVNGEIDALKQLVTDGATSAEVIAALEALKVTTGNVETTVQETQNQAQTADDKNPDAPTPA